MPPNQICCAWTRLKATGLLVALGMFMFADAASKPDNVVAGNQLSVGGAMESLWLGNSSFTEIKTFTIQSDGPVARRVPSPSAVDTGTQIVAFSRFLAGATTWYLFNREFYYGAAQPRNCPSSLPISRIVVRSSDDHGLTWSQEAVVAEPNINAGECQLVDGHAFYDPEEMTWHYLCQMLTGRAATSAMPLTWNINHYSLPGTNPMSRFKSDPANPVIKSGQLWRRICGAGKSCPNGTAQEGTPEISFKTKGFFYVTFHGAVGANPVMGFRGVAKTEDFHAWFTHIDDVSDPRLPDDALWSARDCNQWKFLWSTKTGCIGGGLASTLTTPRYIYMIIESADLSLDCVLGQNWVVGLVRAPNISNGENQQRFVSSGHWQQFPKNPLLKLSDQTPCAIQYPRFFVDNEEVFLTYCVVRKHGPDSGNPNSVPYATLHIEKLIKAATLRHFKVQP